MTRLAPILLVALSACQLFDDATYKPRVGPPVPDAPPPPPADAALNGACPVIPGDTCGGSGRAGEISYLNDVRPLINRTTPGGCMSHTLMATVKFDPSTYTSLRAGGANSGSCSGDHPGPCIIVPCRPCDSILIQKLGPMPPFGTRMPMDNYFWTEPEMAVLREWIAQGARDN